MCNKNTIPSLRSFSQSFNKWIQSSISAIAKIALFWTEMSVHFLAWMSQPQEPLLSVELLWLWFTIFFLASPSIFYISQACHSLTNAGFDPCL